MKFYSLYPEENDEHGVAYAPEGLTFKVLYRKGVIAEWHPIAFTLRDGAFTDYQWNSLGWHMCSEKLKRILAECAGADDAIQWLPVSVRAAAGEERPYYVLHLPKPSDVLSKTRTIMSGVDVVVKPVLDASRIGDRRIFTYSDEGVMVYVDASTRKRVRAANITGLDFLPVPVVEDSSL
jgi:hypothetical protein